MMNPDCHYFSPPPSNITREVFPIEKEDAMLKKIRQKHFNTKMILQIPDAPQGPAQILDIMKTDTTYYLVKGLHIYQLVEKLFVDSFVKHGKIYCLSCNTKQDTDNSAAFSGEGSLYLSVNQFIYHSLAIEGTLSKHVLRSLNDRFFMKVDTQSHDFQCFKKYYSKTVDTLKSSQLKFDFWISWQPNDPFTCPSSIAKYFYDKGYTVTEIDPTITQNLKAEVRVPTFSLLDDLGKEDLTDVLEWLGLQAIDVQNYMNKDLDHLLSTGPPCSINQSFANGLYTPEKVIEIIQAIKFDLNQRSSNTPWISLTVYGHPDSPVSSGDSEHSYYVNGDNFYTIIVFRDGYWLFKINDSTKPLRHYVKSSNK